MSPYEKTLTRTIYVLVVILIVFTIAAALGGYYIGIHEPREVSIPPGFSSDPAFWEMLTPEGQEILSVVVVRIEAKCEIIPGYPYTGGVYDNITNTIRLCGEEAQSDPMVLRHEALHALDVADGHPASEDPCFQKLTEGDLTLEAETLYETGGGGWFRPGELYAMIPLVVDWHFDQLTPVLAAYYAEWFTGARVPNSNHLLIK